MLMQAVLTVAESKRLIAKGVAAHPLVREALENGTVIIARGSTNGYVADELLGEEIDKLAFLTGYTLPRGHGGPGRAAQPRREIVIREGEVMKEATLATALSEMKAGDVFIKGANALNYDEGAAGIFIGSPQGGTIGAALPRIMGSKAHLVVPAGLEKLVASDLVGVSEVIAADPCGAEPLRALWVVHGATIITEIEALEICAGVQCHHLASGGIGGAEGSVRVLVSGGEEALGRARQLLDSVAGEQPFPI